VCPGGLVPGGYWGSQAWESSWEEDQDGEDGDKSQVARLGLGEGVADQLEAL
jgi:hypothetical protein